MAGPEKQVVTPPPVVAPPAAKPFFGGQPPAAAPVADAGKTGQPAAVDAGKTGQQPVVPAADADKKGTQVVAGQATDDDKKKIVADSIDYLKMMGESIRVSKITADNFETYLTKILGVYKAQESTAKALNDDALLTSLQQTVIKALRPLFFNASTQLKVPLVKLYLQNMYRLPDWAWPDSTVFNLTKDDDKKAFLKDSAAALSDTALFAGYKTIDEPTLIDVLGRLKKMVDEQELMINNQFSRDAAMKEALHAAFRVTLKALFGKLPYNPARPAEVIYLELEYAKNLIPYWADQKIGDITTPLPLNMSADPFNREVAFMIDGVKITMQPDDASQEDHAKTGISKGGSAIGVTTMNGKVDTFDLPPVTIEIKTTYGAGLYASGGSGYGRGTTHEDEINGDKSLGFHEGNHGRDFLRYIMTHQPFPKFEGKIGMKEADFNAKATDYNKAWKTYMHNMNRGSELSTDCVGKTIEYYYEHQDPPKVSPVKCD